MSTPWSGTPDFEIKANTLEEYEVEVLKNTFKGPVFKRIIIIFLLIISAVFYGNQTVGAAFLGVGLVVLTFIFFISRGVKFAIERKIKKHNLTSDQNIAISSGIVFFPGYLNYDHFNKKNQPEVIDNYFSLAINQIKDFELIPSGKYNKRHFRITYLDGAIEKVLHVLATLSKEEVKSFQKALSNSFAGLVGKNNPFNEIAEIQRKKKKVISVILTFIILICVFVTTYFSVLHPPVLFWSSAIQYLIYGVSVGLLLGYTLKKTLLSSILNARFGKPVSPIFYFSTFCIIGTSLLVVLNINMIKDIVETEATVKRKYSRVRKGKRHYYVYLDLKVDTSGLSYVIDEETKLRTSVTYFKFIYPGKTRYKVFINKGLLNIPHVDRYDVQKNSQLIQGKSNSEVFRKEILKGSPSFNKEKYEVSRWLPEATSFQKANKVKIDKWPNGQMRSKEPILNGKRHGIGQYFHSNGRSYAMITWIDGKKHGNYITWTEDGKIEARYSYKEGELHGRIEWYNEQGEISQVRYYKNGKLIP